MGIEAYHKEQTEKAQALSYLLTNCNDGRRKTLYCVALLELQEINAVLDEIEAARDSKAMPKRNSGIDGRAFAINRTAQGH